MAKDTHRIASDLVAAGAIALMLVMGPQAALHRNETAGQPSHRVAAVAFPIVVGPNRALAQEPLSLPNSPALRVARRLSVRLAKHDMASPPLSNLVTAIEEQQQLLRRHLQVNIAVPGQTTTLAWDADPQRYPQWIKATISRTDAHFAIEPQEIERTLTEDDVPGVTRPTDTVLTAVAQDDRQVIRATTEGVARSGMVFDAPQATAAILKGLQNNAEQVTLALHPQSGTITNATDTNLGELTLLGSGLSDYSNSPWARIQNIRKALNQQVNNVVVPPGATFSFNDTLGGPVTQSRGWYDAKVIFDAVDLRMAPGGGICQASTTVFRAMLHAGLKEVERANHSMYVTYYEKHGVGIDATVFPGKQDLTFVNDTGNYLLLQAYTDGNEAHVNLYGTPDGRTADLRGPYFANSDLSDFPTQERLPHTNEIKWIQRIAFADGHTEERAILSRYVTGLPRSLSAKYNALHAAAAASGTTLVSER